MKIKRILCERREVDSLDKSLTIKIRGLLTRYRNDRLATGAELELVDSEIRKLTANAVNGLVGPTK